MSTFLNPGSSEALDRGCTCPVLDNNHGTGSEWGVGKFWISGDCLMHGRTTLDLGKVIDNEDQ